ncbi:MAG TPA: ABC transporter permease [Chitinophagales bacterium]
MNFEFFVVRKIALSGKKSFSAFIIRLAIASVILSVAAMIIAVSFINGFQSEIRKKIFGFWGHVHIMPYSLTNSYSEEGVFKYADYVDEIKNRSEVAHIQAVAMKGGLIKTKEAFDKIILRGVGKDFSQQNFENYLLKGKFFSGDSAERVKQLVISSETARRLKLGVGDKAIIYFPAKTETKARALRVSGIYETGIEEFDHDFAFVDIGLIQSLNNWGNDTVSSFEVFLKDEHLFKSRLQSYALIFFGKLLSEENYTELAADPIDKTAMALSYAIDDVSVEAVSIKDIYPGLFDWLDLQTMNELIILILMILVAGINMITTLLILVMERTRMIGILKAVGTTDFSIRKIFLYYGMFILFVGVIAGTFIGVSLCLVQQHFHLIQLPQESYYLKFAPILLDFKSILAIDFSTLFLGFLVLLIPTLLVKRISVVKAIKFD